MSQHTKNDLQDNCFLCCKYTENKLYYRLTDSTLKRITRAIGLNLRDRKEWFTQIVCADCNSKILMLIEQIEIFRRNIYRTRRRYYQSNRPDYPPDPLDNCPLVELLPFEYKRRSSTTNGNRSTIVISEDRSAVPDSTCDNQTDNGSSDQGDCSLLEPMYNTVEDAVDTESGGRIDKDALSGRQSTSQYQCSMCEKVYKSQYKMTKHQRSHSNIDQPIKKKSTQRCPKCPETFDSLIARRRHQKTHYDTFQCPGCERTFITRNEYEWHIVTCRKMVSDSSSEPNRKRPRTRSQTRSMIDLESTNTTNCSRQSIVMSPVQRISIQKWTRQLNDADRPPIESISNQIQEIENISMSSISNLSSESYVNPTDVKRKAIERNTYHRRCRRAARELGMEYFPCKRNDCLYGATTLGDIMRHDVSYHRALRLFTCEEHRLSFTTKEYLFRHMRTHRPERLFCLLCDDTFSTKYELEMHTRNQDHKFLCDRCDKRYIRRTQLELHKQQPHENVIEKQGIILRIDTNMNRTNDIDCTELYPSLFSVDTLRALDHTDPRSEELPHDYLPIKINNPIDLMVMDSETVDCDCLDCRKMNKSIG